MRRQLSSILALTIVLAGGCAQASSPGDQSGASPTLPPVAQALPASGTSGGEMPRLERKILRTAEITIEAENPEDSQREATALAERHGGYVESSEVRGGFGSGRARSGPDDVTVTLVMRVPSERFGATLDALRKMGVRVAHEKVNGKDVTEEYVELEARIRTERALELQMLEILKDAKTVKDALDVQKQLADVRFDLEKLEGRRRFLDTQSALSTLTVTMTKRAEIVAKSGFGFGHSVHEAARNSVDVATGIVNGLIRLLGVLLPIALLLGLPAWLLGKLWVRRIRQDRETKKLVSAG